jgi:hypothetical protein
VTFTPLLRAPAIVQWHIAGALVALAPGTAVLFMRKGTRIHRRIGWFWVGAMFLVAITSFWITGIQTGSIQPDPSSLDPNAGDASIRNLGTPRRPHHLASRGDDQLVCLACCGRRFHAAAESPDRPRNVRRLISVVNNAAVSARFAG